MAVVRVQLDRNSGESVIFGTIALLRGIQGFAVGILYVFLQVTIFLFGELLFVISIFFSEPVFKAEDMIYGTRDMKLNFYVQCSIVLLCVKSWYTK